MSEQTTVADESNAASAGAPFRYDAQLAAQIEVRWQDRWERAGTFQSPNPSGSLSAGFERVSGLPKAYILDMFAAQAARESTLATRSATSPPMSTRASFG